MTEAMRIRAVAKDGVTDVRILAAHPMETGRRVGTGGALIPAHHITDLSVKHHDRMVLNVRMSGGISTNPFFAFKFKGGAKGESLAVTWVDNKGQTRTDEAKIG